MREALAAITLAHGPNPHGDPTAAIVWQLVAGMLAPEDAIAAIRELVQTGVLAALDAQPPQDFVFSEVQQ